MTAFTHTDFPTQHRGVARMEAAFTAVGQLRPRFQGARGLAALLLAAAVSAVVVLADSLVDSGSGLLAVWMVTWVALALFAAPARRLASATVRSLNGWSAAIAEARADQRLWAVARADARVMGDLQAAMTRGEAPSSRPVPFARQENASAAVKALPSPDNTVALRDAAHELGARRGYYY